MMLEAGILLFLMGFIIALAIFWVTKPKTRRSDLVIFHICMVMVLIGVIFIMISLSSQTADSTTMTIVTAYLGGLFLYKTCSKLIQDGEPRILQEEKDLKKVFLY